jgi:hypothetical protein
MLVCHSMVLIPVRQPRRHRRSNAKIAADGRYVWFRSDADELLTLCGQLLRGAGHARVADVRAQPGKRLPIVVIENPDQVFHGAPLFIHTGVNIYSIPVKSKHGIRSRRRIIEIVRIIGIRQNYQKKRSRITTE